MGRKQPSSGSGSASSITSEDFGPVLSPTNTREDVVVASQHSTLASYLFDSINVNDDTKMALSTLNPPATKRHYSADEMIIDYFDAVIYGRDLALLESRNEWLNDSTIHFYFTYLQTSSASDDLMHQPKPSLLFMDPSAVSFWMHQCTDQEDVDDFKAGVNFPPSLSTTGVGGYIFVPINDNHAKSSDWTQPGAGMHWSLLLVHVMQDEDENNDNIKGSDSSSITSLSCIKFYHFDSCKSSGNIQAAQDVAQRFCDDIYFPRKDGESLKRSKQQERVTVTSPPTPQQTNAYDCGVHVMGGAAVISAILLSDSINVNDDTKMIQLICQELFSVFGSDPAQYCAKLRRDVASEIRRLADGQTTHS